MSPILIIEGIITGLVGVSIGYVARHYVAVSRRGSIEADIAEKLLQAKREANAIEEEALQKAMNIREEAKKTEQRISKQEERLDKREQDLSSRDEMINRELNSLRDKSKEIQIIKENLENKEQLAEKEIQKVEKSKKCKTYFKMRCFNWTKSQRLKISIANL